MVERVLEKIYEVFPKRVLVFVGLSAAASFFSLLLTHDEVLIAPTISYALIAMATVVGMEMFPNFKYTSSQVKFMGVKVGILTLISLPTALLIMPTWESACILTLTSSLFFFRVSLYAWTPLGFESLYNRHTTCVGPHS